MHIKRQTVLIGILILLVLALPFRRQIYHHIVMPILIAIHGQKTIDDRVQQFGPKVHKRLRPFFTRQHIAYPSAQLVFLGIKSDRVLQIYAAGTDRRYRFIRSYPILGASGDVGPKLREGDMQVPEGIYGIESLNPNSLYHLSLRINYPNAFDREMAQHDRRTSLGGDIMIHGSDCSIGCLAMGDEAAEDLFILAHDTGLRHVEVVLSPVDARRHPMPMTTPRQPAWIKMLYEQIAHEMDRFPLPVNE
ncbi:MAG TPA: L,D-transpeptidase family protein [Armatimonadota bacterium]|nr:L,D-transpeptidase family protein [Armatimonadota bacterium]